jgi:hypothetical protein
MGTVMQIGRSAVDAAARANNLLSALGLHSLDVPGEVFDWSLVAPLAKPTPVKLTVSDLSLRNLDGFNRVLYLQETCSELRVEAPPRRALAATQGSSAALETQPTEPVPTASTLTGSSITLASNGLPPVSIHATLGLRMLGHSLRWRASLTAAEAEFAEAHELLLAMRRFRTLTLADLTSPCVLSPLRGVRLDLLAANVKTFEISLAPEDTRTANASGLNNASWAPRAAQLSTATIGSFLSSLRPSAVSAVNDVVAIQLQRAHNACELGERRQADEVEQEDMQQLGKVVLAAIYSTAALIITAFVGGHLHAHRGRVRMGDAGGAAKALVGGGGAPSLAAFFSPSLVYGVSILLLLNICIFLSSNAFPGAVVRATVHLAGAPLPPMDAFQFALAESVIRFWRTGGQGYTLSFLIAFYSGVWPYVKLCLTLFCLWASPAVLPERTRGWLLSVFEALGKWSLIDSLMIFILMAAMRMDFVVPPSPDSMLSPGANDTLKGANYTGDGAADAPPPLLQVSAEVMPTAGISLFTLGVVLSLLLTAVVAHMHRTLMLTPHGEERDSTAARALPTQRSCASTACAAVRASAPSVLVHSAAAGDSGYIDARAGNGAKAPGARSARNGGLPTTRASVPLSETYDMLGQRPRTISPRPRRLSLLLSPAALSEPTPHPLEPDPISGHGRAAEHDAAASPIALRASLRSSSADRSPRGRLPREVEAPPSCMSSCCEVLRAVMVAVALLLAIGLSAYAWFIPIFSLSKEGILGVAIGGERASKEYSVLDGASFLLLASPSSPPWLMRALQLLYYAVLIVGPALFYALSLFLWVVPLHAWLRHHAGFLLQLLYSFSAVDVYLLCMVLSLLQLDKVSQQITAELSHGGCASAEPTLDAHFSDLLGGTPTCLTLSSALLSAYWLLLAATLLGLPAGIAVARTLDREHLRIGGETAAAAEREAVERNLATLFASVKPDHTNGKPPPPEPQELDDQTSPQRRSGVSGLRAWGVGFARRTLGYADAFETDDAIRAQLTRAPSRGYSQEML